MNIIGENDRGDIAGLSLCGGRNSFEPQAMESVDTEPKSSI